MSNKNLSKFISLILRHKPEEIGIELDGYGWAVVEELISGINDSGRHIDMNILEDIVDADEKNRYSFNIDKTLIRANQGHSISVDLQFKKVIPPQYLYHGTAVRFLNSIKKLGILPMSRLYVHLSNDCETAEKVGRRHGTPVILKIDTKSMHELGYEFYISENGVYLVDYIPWKFVKEEIYI